MWVIAGLAFIGFLDALYLTVNHYAGAELNCFEFSDCNAVTQSKYSEVFGIPLSLLGVLYYLTVLLSSLLYIDKGIKKLLTLIAIITPLGFLFSLFFMYLQVFVIGSICAYCTFSACTSTLLFIFALKLHKAKPFKLSS